MYEAGDVRVEDVPDPSIVEPTDAIVRVTRACICGSDLWPYKTMEPSESGRVMGHEAIGVVEAQLGLGSYLDDPIEAYGSDLEDRQGS
jgi:threonine dehydrogenase-like Zn-dependent dehydrogenase